MNLLNSMQQAEVADGEYDSWGSLYLVILRK